MVTDEVKLKYGHTWRGVLHMPVNVCSRCGEEDDPESAARWPEDDDGDRVCRQCAEALGLEDD